MRHVAGSEAAARWGCTRLLAAAGRGRPFGAKIASRSDGEAAACLPLPGVDDPLHGAPCMLRRPAPRIASSHLAHSVRRAATGPACACRKPLAQRRHGGVRAAQAAAPALPRGCVCGLPCAGRSPAGWRCCGSQWSPWSSGSAGVVRGVALLVRVHARVVVGLVRLSSPGVGCSPQLLAQRAQAPAPRPRPRPARRAAEGRYPHGDAATGSGHRTPSPGQGSRWSPSGPELGRVDSASRARGSARHRGHVGIAATGHPAQALAPAVL